MSRLVSSSIYIFWISIVGAGRSDANARRGDEEVLQALVGHLRAVAALPKQQARPRQTKGKRDCIFFGQKHLQTHKFEIF
jgi:hypothetical protein